MSVRLLFTVDMISRYMKTSQRLKTTLYLPFCGPEVSSSEDPKKSSSSLRLLGSVPDIDATSSDPRLQVLAKIEAGT